MVNTILTSYPDGRRASPEYVAELVKAIAELTPEEKDWVIDRRDGIVARCPKFMPTVGEVMELVRDRRDRRDQFRPTTSGYKRLNAEQEPDPWSEAEHDGSYRKAVVQKHWPAREPPRTKRAALVPPTTDDLKRAAELLRLKAPAQSDASRQLHELVRRQNEER